jgi:MFS family permease
MNASTQRANGCSASADLPHQADKCVDDRRSLPATASRGYLVVAVGLLFAITLMNYMDRFVMSILVEPVRREFTLTDTQAGLLTGLGFTFLYSLLLVPIARLADTYSRRKILALAILVWSAMTLLCGAVSSYGSLLLARAGVGVGEAAGLPTTHSVASDMFSPRVRPLVFSLIALGGSVGAMLGFSIGGYVAQHYGWRQAFLVVGLPGLLLAMIVLLVLRDPARANPSEASTPTERSPATKEVIRQLMGRRAYVHIVAAATLAAISMLGATAWNAAFYMREHHMTSSAAGAWLGASSAIGTFGGTLLSGWWCSRFYRRDGRTLLIVMGVSFGLIPIVALAVYLTPNTHLSLALLPILLFVGSLWLGPFFTSQQELGGRRYRATASAVGLVFYNLLGSGIGPLTVGAISDRLTGWAGVNSLRYALVLNLIFCIWGFVHIVLANRTMAADLENARLA